MKEIADNAKEGGNGDRTIEREIRLQHAKTCNYVIETHKFWRVGGRL